MDTQIVKDYLDRSAGAHRRRLEQLDGNAFRRDGGTVPKAAAG